MKLYNVGADLSKKTVDFPFLPQHGCHRAAIQNFSSFMATRKQYIFHRACGHSLRPLLQLQCIAYRQTYT